MDSEANAAEESSTAKEEGGTKCDTTKRPKWLVNNKKPQTGQLSRTRMWNGNKWYWCSEETGGKCEGHWVRHTPTSCEGKAFKGFKKRGMLKQVPKPERVGTNQETGRK